MATFETSVYAAAKPDRSNPSRLAQPNNASGNVEYVRCKYTLLGTEAAADKINLCVLPYDQIPLPGHSFVFSADPGTTLTMDIGTAADPDGWADGLVLSNGGKIDCLGGSTPAPAWVESTPLVADTGALNVAGSAAVYATIVSANTLTPGVVLYFTLAYIKQK